TATLDWGWIKSIASQFSNGPGREAAALELAILSPEESADVRLLFSKSVSRELDSVRLVLWWSNNRFRPALYCPDLKTALFTFVLMRVVSGRGWGVCLHCGVFFIQKRSDQTYCTIAHREAHRVARWRASKANRSRKKGGHYVPRKAR